MIRRFLSVIALAITGLLLSIGFASADDYVPAAVTSGGSGGSAGTSAGDVSGALSYTGAGFSVGGAVVIAAVVLVLGIALVVVGARMTRRRTTGS